MSSGPAIPIPSKAQVYSHSNDGTDADFLRGLLCQVREDPLVDLVVAECGLALFEAQAPQPDRSSPPLFRGLVVVSMGCSPRKLCIAAPARAKWLAAPKAAAIAGQLPQPSKNEFGWPFHELDRR